MGTTLATKEIYLRVITEGTEKAKADLRGTEETVKRTEKSLKEAGNATGGFGDALNRLGKVKEAVNQKMEAFNFLTQTLTFALGGGLVGAIGGAISGIIDLGKAILPVIDYDKLLEDQLKKTNEAVAERAKKAKELADLQFSIYESGRAKVASAVGVAPEALSGSGLEKSFEVGRKQNEIQFNRNALERELNDLLLERRAIQTKGEFISDPFSIPAAALLNQANRVGARIRTVEANLRRLRREQGDLDAEVRRFGGGGSGGSAGKAGAARKAATESEPKLPAYLAGPIDFVTLPRGEAGPLVREAQRKQFAKADVATLAARKAEEARLAADVAEQDRRTKDAEDKIKGRIDSGRTAGNEAGVFALIGENDAAKIYGIREAIYEGIVNPSTVAYEAVNQLAMGMADAAAAAIMEGRGFKAASNEVLKAVARKALAMSIFEGAAALASLAILDFRGAALHGQAAATFGIVAGASLLGAAATGGIRSKSASSGGSGAGSSGSFAGSDRGSPNASTSSSGSAGPVVYNFTISYNGFRANTRDHEELVRMLNSQAGRNGSARIDRRVLANA